MRRGKLTARSTAERAVSCNYIPLLRPEIKERRNSTIKIKNRILAMEAAPAAMPKKPKTPAMIAMMRKISVQRNIWLLFS
jgi:hypothetical protein